MKRNNFIKRIKAKAQVNRYINCSESFHSGIWVTKDKRYKVLYRSPYSYESGIYVITDRGRKEYVNYCFFDKREFERDKKLRRLVN